MKIPFLDPILELGKTWMEGRNIKTKAKAEAEAQILVNASKSVADWEAYMAKASQTSWKDEFWTIILAIPLVLCFIPGTEEHLSTGFATLEKMPEWYRYFLYVAIGASFGVRIGPKIFGKK